MRVRIKSITWRAGLIAATVLAFHDASFVDAGDTSSFTAGEFSRVDPFYWPGTYISDDAYNAHSERNVQKLIIEETHRKKASCYKVHAWLTGLQGFPSSEEVSIDDGTVEAYVELDHWPKVWDNDTIVASFPSVKDRPIVVITRGPLERQHYKFINVTCYWSTLSTGKGHDGFYIKRRLYRKPDAH